MQKPTRRRLLAGLAASGAAVAGFPAIVRANEPVTLITPFGFEADFIDMMNAYSGGHFAREGLDAKVLGASGTVQHLQQIIAGLADYGRFSGIDFIRAVATKDAPLKAFATMRQNSGFTIVSPKDKPVRSGKDLAGKTIGLLSVGGTTQTFVEVLMAKAGVAKDESKMLVTGDSPGEVDLIRQGRIDCFICTYTVAYILRQSGQPLEFLGVEGPVPAPGQIFHATRATLDKKPELTLKVLRAIRASELEIIKGPAEMIFERASKDFEIPGIKNIALLAAQQRQAIVDNWYADGKPETLLRNLPDRWQSGCDALRAVGFADVKDPTPLYTNEFLDRL